MVQPDKKSHTHRFTQDGGVVFYFKYVLCPVFAEFSFTCMVGLTNALELDGFISGFMGFYLRMVRWPTLC